MSPSFPPRSIHINSKYPTNNYGDPSLSKCNFQLNRPIIIPSEYELHISVVSASIPYTFYAIPYTALFFVSGGATYAWTSIAPGNWSATDLLAFLNVQPTFLTVSFTPQQGVFNFKNTSSSNITILSSILLGLNANRTLSPQQTYKSDVCPDIGGPRFINILSSLNTDAITTGTTPSGSGSLVSIPVNASPGNFIIFQPNNLIRNKLKETYISGLDIVLCDSNMTPLNMNGSYWEIDLLIELYEPPDQQQEYSENPTNSDLFSSVKGYKPRKPKM